MMLHQLFNATSELWRLGRTDPVKTLRNHVNRGPLGVQRDEKRETDTYTIHHSIIDGIERIEYRPHEPRFSTPIFMQHGMWHGAWCWAPWQSLFAEWGWTSVAGSLPGHAGSPEQLPIEACTLDYYLGFVRDEIDRFPKMPIYFGHSMGGALLQWYLKFIGDEFPAAVLVAPWVSHAAMTESFMRFYRAMPEGVRESFADGESTALVSTPERAGKILLNERSSWTPDSLHAKLGRESALVTWQHNPPFWRPPKNIRTPILWLAGEDDALISVKASSKSAAFYGADFKVIAGAPHNVMMAHNYKETAEDIRRWLETTTLSLEGLPKSPGK